MRALFRHPVGGNIKWREVEALLIALGAKIEERSGSRVAILFPDQHPAIFHRPHPSPNIDKGAIAALRKWLSKMGMTPKS